MSRSRLTHWTRELRVSGLLAVLVAVVSLGGAGCGGADPFVGSWRDTPANGARDLVIAKVGATYKMAFLSGPTGTGSLPLTREGDTLTGTFEARAADRGAIAGKITITVANGRLLVTDGVLRGYPFTKVSDGTAAPSPRPAPADTAFLAQMYALHPQGTRLTQRVVLPARSKIPGDRWWGLRQRAAANAGFNMLPYAGQKVSVLDQPIAEKLGGSRVELWTVEKDGQVIGAWLQTDSYPGIVGLREAR